MMSVSAGAKPQHRGKELKACKGEEMKAQAASKRDAADFDMHPDFHSSCYEHLERLHACKPWS